MGTIRQLNYAPLEGFINERLFWRKHFFKLSLFLLIWLQPFDYVVIARWSVTNLKKLQMSLSNPFLDSFHKANIFQEGLELNKKMMTHLKKNWPSCRSPVFNQFGSHYVLGPCNLPVPWPAFICTFIKWPLTYWE